MIRDGEGLHWIIPDGEFGLVKLDGVDAEQLVRTLLGRTGRRGGRPVEPLGPMGPALRREGAPESPTEAIGHRGGGGYTPHLCGNSGV